METSFCPNCETDREVELYYKVYRCNVCGEDFESHEKESKTVEVDEMCLNCKFHRIWGDNSLHCHRYPQQTYPKLRDHWCGEWQEMKKKKEE